MLYGQEVQIEDMRNHPAELIVSLRQLLAGGADITPDPKRPGFYEVESDSTVYYICDSRTSGKILLLATWPAESVLAEAHAAA